MLFRSNVSAGWVFTDYLIKKTRCDDTPEIWKSIEKAFITRVKSLKRQFKRDVLPQAEKLAEWLKHSWKQHKYKVRFQVFPPTIAHLLSSCFTIAVRLPNFMPH